jgi:hypothetical protein
MLVEIEGLEVMSSDACRVDRCLGEVRTGENGKED